MLTQKCTRKNLNEKGALQSYSMSETLNQINSSASSLNYVTLLFGTTQLLEALYSFFLMGIKRQRSLFLPFQGYQRAFLFFFGLWSLVLAVACLYPDTALLPRIYSLVYVAVPFTSLTFFYFCFTYTFPHKSHWMKYLLWLMVIPLITAIFAIVPDYNKYFVIFTTNITYIPYRTIEEIYQPWFYVHSAYSYALVLVGTLFLIVKVKYPSTQNRKLCIYAIIATALFILRNVYRTFIEADDAIWFMPIFSISVTTLFFLVVYADESQILVVKGQEKLMKVLLFPIFLLDKDGRIIYANKEAREICSNIYQSNQVIGFRQDIMENFAPYQIESGFVQSGFFANEENIILQSKSTGGIFYLHQQEISLRGKRYQNESGTLLMLVAISSMQQFLTTLEDKAFKDSLCGCYNRHFLEIKQIEFANGSETLSQLLPISFIMCDIDGLKVVNDTHGHDKGNEYITLCHHIIKTSVHSTDFIFRLGGDEFLVILPNTEQRVAQDRVATIEAKMQEIKKEYNTSISIGYATADTLPIDYQQLIKEADQQMYQKKNQRKKGISQT